MQPTEAVGGRGGGESHDFYPGDTDGSIMNDSMRHKGCESCAGFTGLTA